MKRLTTVTLLALLALLAGCATQQPAGGTASTDTPAPPDASAAMAAPAPNADASTVLPVDPAVTTGTLPNGLSYYIRENNEPRKRAFLRLALNAGSILEDPDQLGLAHFLEHMAFNGTASYSGNDLISFLEGLGMEFGPDINAYTSFDQTVFELSVPTDDPQTFTKALNVLLEWAHSMTLDPAEIDKERGVIVEEWRYRRGADARMRDVQYPVIFNNSRYADRLPIGDVDLIRTFPPSVLRRFYQDWYRPDLMSIVAVGDFSAPEVQKEITQLFSPLQNPADERPRETFNVPDHNDTKYVIASDPEASYTTVSLYVKRDAEPLVTEGDYRNLLISQLFSSMFNDRLDEITRRPDAPFLGAGVSSGSLVRTKAAATISAAVEGNEVAPALEALLVEAKRISDFGFTPTELERAKTNQMRSIEQAYRERDNHNSSSYADEYVRAFTDQEAIPGIPYERQLYQKLLPAITLDEVNSKAGQYLAGSNRVISVSSVQKDGLPPVQQAELRGAVADAESVVVGPYVDKAVSSDLLGTLPAPGSVVSEQRLDAEGAIQWDLSNGARVIVLPTNYRADQVVFGAFSDGGTSQADADAFRSAQYATVFTEQMGYGSFSPSDLQRVLAGKSLSVSPYIDTYQEGFSGSASVQDLETALQLLNLKMTSPRRDQATFDALKRQFQTVVSNQDAQPQYLFSRRFQQLYSNDNPRTLPIDKPGVDSINLDDVITSYLSRYQDASGFTFVFVGTIDLDPFKRLVERYIATLPSTGVHQGWRDVGINRPTETKTDTIKAGIDPIGEVLLAFYGTYDFSQDNNYRIRALERMLEIRLQEVIREDESGTYGVAVQAQFTRIPEDRYTILINFRSDPARVDELTAKVFDVIAEIQSTPPTAEHLKRITETQSATFREQLTSNDFWLAQLTYALQNGRPVSAIRHYLDLVNALTPADIQAAAQRYIDTSRYVEVTLKPADK